MEIEACPTAAASYARSLIARGCPISLATQAGHILARTENVQEQSAKEKAIVARAYASLIR